MSHVTHMNESCHTYGWVTSNTWRSHVAHTNDLCITHLCICLAWVKRGRSSSLFVSRIHMNESLAQGNVYIMESCRTSVHMVARPWYEAKGNIWMSHVVHIKESCRTYEWVVSYVKHMNELCLKKLNWTVACSFHFHIHIMFPEYECDSGHIYILEYHFHIHIMFPEYECGDIICMWKWHET